MWRYDQRTGELWEGDQYVATGYSGTKEFKNVPEAQNIKSFGPVPRGLFDVGPLHNSPNVGPDVMNLEALPGTEVFGRGDFRIHGDSKLHPGAASHGCIILPHEIRLRIAAVRGTLEVFTS